MNAPYRALDTVNYIATGLQSGRLRIARIDMATGPVFEMVRTPGERCAALLGVLAALAITVAVVVVPSALLALVLWKIF